MVDALLIQSAICKIEYALDRSTLQVSAHCEHSKRLRDLRKAVGSQGFRCNWIQQCLAVVDDTITSSALPDQSHEILLASCIHVLALACEILGPVTLTDFYQNLTLADMILRKDFRVPDYEKASEGLIRLRQALNLAEKRSSIFMRTISGILEHLVVVIGAGYDWSTTWSILSMIIRICVDIVVQRSVVPLLEIY